MKWNLGSADSGTRGHFLVVKKFVTNFGSVLENIFENENIFGDICLIDLESKKSKRVWLRIWSQKIYLTTFCWGNSIKI